MGAIAAQTAQKQPQNQNTPPPMKHTGGAVGTPALPTAPSRAQSRKPVAAPSGQPSQPTAATPTQTGATGQATALTEDEKKALKNRKEGRIHKVVKKAAGMSGEPSSTPVEKSKKDKALGGLGTAAGLAGSGVDATVGIGGFAVDAAGTAMDLTGTVGDMVSQFGKISEFSESALGITGAAFSVAGLLGPVKDSVALLIDGVKQVVDLGLLIKGCVQDGVDGWAIADHVLGTASLLASGVSTGVSWLSGALSTAMSIAGLFVNIAPGWGYVISPIIGGINLAITTFQSILSFASHAKDIAKAGRGWYNTRKQKWAAKEAIAAKQDANDPIVEKTNFAKANGFNNKKIAKKDFGTAGKNDKRKKRLDEYTAEQRSKGGAMNEEVLTSLENYDISKELEQTNKKRVLETSLDVLMDDVEPIISSAMAIIPGGIGSIGSMGLNLLTTGVGAARTSVKYGKKIGGALHIPGFNRNKTVKKKLLRRHNLAVTVFKRVRGLDQYNLENMDIETKKTDEADNIRQALGEYNMVSGWIKGMGVMHKTLLKAKDPDEMVETMRDGFYSGV